MFQMPNFNVHTPNHIIDLRLAMISEKEDGAKMDSILIKYKTTKPTFYKFFKRYHQFGEAGLHDISKAPQNHGTKTSEKDERVVEELFVQHPYFSSYELNQLIPINPRTIQRIILRKNLKKVYKPKSQKKTILEKLKKESEQKRKQKK